MRIPGHTELAIATQRPYVPERLSLRSLLAYPAAGSNNSSASNAAGEGCGAAEDDALLESILIWCGLEAVLAKCGNSLDAPVGRLSGGEMQRIAIARLRLRPPALAILDEPTANVEVAFEGKLFGWLSESRMTVVTVGHRAELRQHHTHELTIAADGKCTLRQL